MRVLFYGTPDFALPTLDALLAHHQVVAVVTQPDRPAGRGQRSVAPPVKRRAEAAGLPVVQPNRLRDPEWPERLGQYDAEVAVVVAFGQILPKAALDVPRRGSINVHASLLPRYRGAAPIAWAIIHGETETGITTFQMDPGMDTGDMLLTESTLIGAEETAGELSSRMSVMGARVLMRTLDALETLTPAGRLLIWRATAVPQASDAGPGTLVESGPTLGIATGEGLLVPVQVQPENRKAMGWGDF